MKSIIKNYLYSLSSIALIGSFLVASSPVHGVNILPVDTIIQQAYSRAAQGNDFNSLTKSLTKGGNVYDSAYKLAKKNSLGAVSDTFTNVANNLNAQYKCSLNSTDVANIAAGDASLNASLAGLAGKTTLPVDSANMVKSCVRIVQCAKGNSADTDVQSLTDNYTQGTFPLCRQIISQAYTNTLSIISRQNTLDGANRGDDIFFNGTLDDSPYDLLKDMQLIGDVLFKSNTPAPQVTLYNPTSPAGNPFMFFNASNDGSPNLSVSFNPNGGNSSNNNGSSTTTTTTTSTGLSIFTTNPDASTKTLTSSQSEGLKELIAYHQTIQQRNTTTTTQGGGTTNTNSIASSNGLICTTGTMGGITEDSLTQNEILGTQLTQSTILEQSLYQYIHTINATQATYDTLTSVETQQNDGSINTISNLANSDIAADGTSTDDPTAAANSCVSKCDTLNMADQAACVAKCLCGTKRSNNGIFGISVCTVPVKQNPVIAGKTVKSVEEIVDELNTVFTALKNSGQLIKHKKQKEFLDTSLSKIKLNKILSFDMNVAFKPIYSTQINKEKKQAEESKQDAIADRARQGSYDNAQGKLGAEKNKYIVLPQPVKQQQENSTISTNDSPPPPNQIEAGFPLTIAKTLNNDMLNAISEFISKNAQLWQQVGETMNAINTTAGNLEKKIEKGN